MFLLYCGLGLLLPAIPFALVLYLFFKWSFVTAMLGAVLLSQFLLSTIEILFGAEVSIHKLISKFMHRRRSKRTTEAADSEDSNDEKRGND